MVPISVKPEIGWAAAMHLRGRCGAFAQERGPLRMTEMRPRKSEVVTGDAGTVARRRGVRYAPPPPSRAPCLIGTSA